MGLHLYLDMWRIGAVRMADCRRWETFHMFCRAIRTNHKDVHVGIVKTFANRLALMSFVLGMDHIVEDQRPGGLGLLALGTC